jgi:glyoxylase-like metal-dependent hydrolase (beta-lactamase superfamily II)
MADAVRTAGVDPAALAGIALTHGHFDHLGGIVDLPGIPVWVPQAELDFASETLEGNGFRMLPAEARALLERGKPAPFAEEDYLYWPQRWDLFGDGSVVLIPTPGHTPGSMAIRVRLPSGERVLLVGDTVWVREGYEQLEPKGGIATLFDDDRAQNDLQIARLHALHALDPALHILPAHDRRVWVEVFGAPGCS